MIILMIPLSIYSQGTNSPGAINKSNGNGASPNLDDLDPPQGVMPGVIRRYTVDLGNLNRFYTAGPSVTRRGRFKQFYTEWLGAIEKLDFNSLSLDDSVDYVLFKNQLVYELGQLEIEAKRVAEMEPLIPFARELMELEDARRRMDTMDSPKTAALLTRIGKQIEDTRKGVEASLKPDAKEKVEKPKKTVANRAVLAINNLRNTLKNWFGFYNAYDPVFTWWTGEPYKKLDESLQNYAAFLREKLVEIKADDKNAIIGDPIGREALMIDLAYEMIPYTPEELIEIAKKEMAWCEAEMLKASRELGFGDDWAKALEHVKMLHVEPGKQTALIRELALEAIDYVEKNELVTVPPIARDTWRMEMMTPERQLVAPFFLGGETILVSYPTNTMQHDAKLMSMRGNNIHFSRATVHHELIPGHHLQGFMLARYRTHRGLFRTPFWMEGWALYWEMLLWDMKFPKTPENRIGMLFWRMHRCARIMFSLGFHLEQMTPQQCIDLLVNRVGHELDNATAEVRRSFAGDYEPLYQIAYMIGGLQFRALHRDLVESGKMTNRAFHDTILRHNSMPVEMVRAELTGQKPERNFTSKWKFYSLNSGR
jgi:uncharacterized protein (DUF885 family)